MDSSTPQLPPGLPAGLAKLPGLDETYGALLIATFIGLILYGITLHQAYRYYRLYPKDPLALKAVVTVTLLLETFYTILLTHVCYFYLTTNYANVLALGRGVWSLNLVPVMSGVVIIATQSFFVRRVYLIGPRYRPIAVLVVVLLVVELGFYIAGTVEAFKFNDDIFATLTRVSWIISTATGILLVADSTLTVALILALNRSRTGFRRSDSVIDVLILYAVSTGFLTGVLDALSLMLALIKPDSLLWAASGVVGTRLYANALLAA
ncbi:hypothetical protein C8Q80DRAFT_107295 [Daedaleopsis nitida]|nr:hypothetical protein C8Q80DRAFT_107295 [Daedaleopsis nitida]